MKIFKLKPKALALVENHDSNEIKCVEKKESQRVSQISDAATTDLEAVNNASIRIKQQSRTKAAFSNSSNIKTLAENDLIISRVIKNVLDWLLIVTSAETLRRDEYEDLTEQMLRFDEDSTIQLETQIKLRKAFDQIRRKQEETEKVVAQLQKMKKLVIVSLALSIISLTIALISICT